MSIAPLSQVALKQITEILNKLYPLKYADKSWDNTGLLLDVSNGNNDEANILLTIDLTEAVAEEAIKKKCNLIVAYHPFLFRKFNKILPNENSQQRSLIKLIQHQISVYAPHTAVDASVGGVNDWLIDGISKGSEVKERKVIIPDPSGDEGVGMGRIVEFENYISLGEAIKRTKEHLGVDYLQVACRGEVADFRVKKVAVCAGSGSGVFSQVREEEDVDLYLTGELSHHELLALRERDRAVVVAGHCNSERGFLAVFAEALRHAAGSRGSPGGLEAVAAVAVQRSAADESPFAVV